MGSIISNFTKGKTFSYLMATKCSLGNLTMLPPFLHPSQKGLPFPFSLGYIYENISENSIERRVYRFVLKIAREFAVPTGRVGIG